MRDEPVLEHTGYAEKRDDGTIDWSTDPEAVRAATEL